MIFRTIGIDVGVSGAVACCVNGELREVTDMPVIERESAGMLRKQVDGRALWLMVREMAPLGEAVHVVCESLHAWPGSRNSPQSTWSLGHSLGCVETVASIANLTLHKVEPRAWKGHYGLIKADKSESRKLAARLFPDYAHLFRRVCDHDRAEAALMAKWAWVKFA